MLAGLSFCRLFLYGSGVIAAHPPALKPGSEAPQSAAPMTGARAAKIRKRLGLTRAALARVLRLSPASGHETVKRWETGETAVSGPVSLALEALDDGWRPADYDARAQGAADA